MLILGLTGSIAMGKSVTARLLRCRRIPVYDADAAVHALLARGGAAVPLVAAEFPACVKDGAVDRKALGARVFGDTPALRRLEAILHPLARRRAAAFVAAAARRRARLVVLDIPLLYETGAQERLDAVLVVSAPAWLQRARALGRPGMTQERLAAVLALQTPDRVKRRRADAVITSAQGVARTHRELGRALASLRCRAPRRWKPGWH
jgi:dephospho-CoA kinase